MLSFFFENMIFGTVLEKILVMDHGCGKWRFLQDPTYVHRIPPPSNLESEREEKERKKQNLR